MTKSEISRQHDDTSMTELVGFACQNLIAVCEGDDDNYIIFYLKLADCWHRFFLDAGLLFWRSDNEPDADDDLGDDGRYVDLGNAYGIVGASVESIVFQNDLLEMKFSNGARLLFESNFECGARLIK